MRSPLPLALLLAAGGASAASDPDAYDPLLDGDGLAPFEGGRPYAPDASRSRGFVVGGAVGLYAGAVRSHLTAAQSRLDDGVRPGVGIGLGWRTRSPVELGLDLMLGLGRSFEAEVWAEVDAYDLLVEPRVLWHFVDGRPWGAYGGVAGSLWLFDLEAVGLSQAGVGPGALLGATRRLGPDGLFFVEVGATALYDYLAFEVVEPTPEDLAEDPAAGPRREEGEWYFVGRLMVGYRLTGF